MLNPPDKMVSQTQALTATIRSSSFDRSTCRYGEFVRDNVMGVLTNTYPLFCRQLPSEQLNALIEEFIDVHHATEPQFHHIATEFAKFIQQRAQQSDVEHCVDVAYNPKSLSSNEVALLEYEWAALSVEVDTVVLPDFFKWHFENNECLGFAVELNPTIHLLALPFIVHSESVTFLTHKRDHVYYALYRDSHQQVMTLALQEIDVAIIQMIQQEPAQTLERLQQNIAQQAASFDFIDWVERFCQLELISVRPVGEIV